MKINQVALQIQINPLTISLFLFFQGLTARRLPLSKECYVSKLDPTLPTPQKLKLDMELVCFVVLYVMTTIYLTIHSNQRKKEGHYSVEPRQGKGRLGEWFKIELDCPFFPKHPLPFHTSTTNYKLYYAAFVFLLRHRQHLGPLGCNLQWCRQQNYIGQPSTER